jgi:hypothetical protein
MTDEERGIRSDSEDLKFGAWIEAKLMTGVAGIFEVAQEVSPKPSG